MKHIDILKGRGRGLITLLSLIVPLVLKVSSLLVPPSPFLPAIASSVGGVVVMPTPPNLQESNPMSDLMLVLQLSLIAALGYGAYRVYRWWNGPNDGDWDSDD